MDELMQTSYAGRTTKVGDLVKGTVVKIAERAVFIDYGAKSEGVADLGEFNDAAGVPQVKVGDTLIQGAPLGRAPQGEAPRITVELRRQGRPVDLAQLLD